MVHKVDFTDYDSIPSGHQKAVNACVSAGIMYGYDDGSFNPLGNVTLAELCKTIYFILFGSRHVIIPFSVESYKGYEAGHWAAPYLERCRQIGIYKKNAETTNPNELATVDDVLEMVSSTSQFLKKDRHILLFKDEIDCRTHFNDFHGKVCITRSALASLLDRFCSEIAEKIYNTCVTDHLCDYYFSATDVEPFLRFCYSEDEVVALMQLISHQHCVSPDGFKIILHLLRYKNSELNEHSCKSPTIDHYTSLQTLKCLTEKDAHLRLYNAAFLNDPSEGAFFHNSLKEFLDNRDQRDQSDRLAELIDHTSKSTPFYPNSAYIVSFSNLNGEDDHNSLPMWFQYADHCKGCAIKFRTKRFGLNVYNVSYGSDGLDSFFEGFFEIFNSIWDSNPAKYTEDAIISIAADILNLVSYLYKNESYEHEQESRIILFSPPQNAKKEDAPRAGELLPRTYLEVPFSIDSVTFGPDVKYPERLAVAFASAGLTCPFRKSSIPFISK